MYFLNALEKFSKCQKLYRCLEQDFGLPIDTRAKIKIKKSNFLCSQEHKTQDFSTRHIPVERGFNVLPNKIKLFYVLIHKNTIFKKQN